MKTRVLVLFSLFFVTRSFAQTPEYFKVGMRWNQTTTCSGAGPQGCMYQTDQNIRIVGDTLLNGLQYFQLSTTEKYSIYYWGPSQPAPCDSYTSLSTHSFGLIRQEGKKVLKWSGNNSPDELFYNYNLQLGDTMPANVFTGEDKLVVTAIDTFYVGNEARLRMSYESEWYRGELLEGIGSSLGLFEPNYMQFECAPYLLCFSSDRTDDYNYPSGQPCYTTLGVNEISTNNQLQVYPNPSSSLIMVNTNQLGLVDVKVINTLGQEVLQFNTETKTSEIAIDVSLLPQGTYLLAAKDVKGNVSHQQISVVR